MEGGPKAIVDIQRLYMWVGNLLHESRLEIILDMSRLMLHVPDQVFDKKVESWSKTCRKSARHELVKNLIVCSWLE